MTARKKVIIVTNTLSHGGAQRVAVRLANALAQRHDVILIPFVREIVYPVSDKVTVLVLASKMVVSHFWGPLSRPLSQIKGLLFFSRLRRKEKPAATFSFLQRPDWLNGLAWGGGKKVMSERNNPRMKEKGYFEDACSRFRMADRVVFQSETVRAMYPEEIRKKGIVIPNPISVSCRASAPDGHRIVAAGRLHPQKNFALLIRAFLRFLPDHPGYTLHIYGEGDDQAELQALIDGLALQDKVFLEGFRSDVHEAIRDAEFFVMSSDYEGMPNSLLEAMMMGLPCISTDFEGAREFIDTAACQLTPVGDETALAGAMAALADDPEKRRNLARRGEEFVQKYSLENIIPRWEALL